jgi:hypothetical protein
MARQESLIQLTGCIGNIIFYKSIDGYLARKKGGIDASRIRSEAAFARTRENNAEFSRAAQATKLIRNAFWPLLQETADARMTGRLNGAMVKVIRQDAVNDRGARNVTNGDLSLLQDFNFNKIAKLATTFHAPFTATIDRPAGTLTVDIPAFDPARMIHAPEEATHFRLKASGAAMDFEKKDYVVAATESADLALAEPQGPLQLNLVVPPASTSPLMLILGIGFMQKVVNGTGYQIADSAYNPMAIVRVDGKLADSAH